MAHHRTHDSSSFGKSHLMILFHRNSSKEYHYERISIKVEGVLRFDESHTFVCSIKNPKNRTKEIRIVRGLVLSGPLNLFNIRNIDIGIFTCCEIEVNFRSSRTNGNANRCKENKLFVWQVGN
ncbi:hypothetical protein CDAR_556751 [Caerostris darwini]|uniref:C2 NT-type domain-containing protein n=1 Tax=Caerostris darwini TaxID=1538125 RepID=A0AAV4PMM0_9ARAC|nr:hypothetical protein CDAR_556751 [Caerostris darwini]